MSIDSLGCISPHFLLLVIISLLISFRYGLRGSVQFPLIRAQFALDCACGAAGSVSRRRGRGRRRSVCGEGECRRGMDGGGVGKTGARPAAWSGGVRRRGRRRLESAAAGNPAPPPRMAAWAAVF